MCVISDSLLNENNRTAGNDEFTVHETTSNSELILETSSASNKNLYLNEAQPRSNTSAGKEEIATSGHELKEPEVYSNKNESGKVSVSLRSKERRTTPEDEIQLTPSNSEIFRVPGKNPESATICSDVSKADEASQSPFQSDTVELTDAHVVRLSERIADKNELLRLGEVVLKLPDCTIRSAITNNQRSIQSAAHDVLTSLDSTTNKQKNRIYSPLSFINQQSNELPYK